MREFSVLVRLAPDVPGQWISHCLNWDLVTQGDSPGHALRMVVEAIAAAIEEDVKAELDPADRAPAPPEHWDVFARTQQRGTRISPADVDSLSESSVLAAILYVASIEERAAVPQHYPLDASVPPPFVIAALQDGDTVSHRRR